jgi:glutathione S-transferase
LALEEAGAEYVDVARLPSKEGGGVAAMMRLLEDDAERRPPFAPPFLKAGRLVIGQTANILLFLGPRLGLVPEDEAARLWAHQLQLTIADIVAEAHNVHHPVAIGLYYEEQKREARRAGPYFTSERIPKFLDYFERVLEGNAKGKEYMIGNAVTYVDLSVFQVMAGLHYAFPRTMQRLAPDYPLLRGLCERMMERPKLAAYLSSERRIPFNEDGIFRHYPELDV